MKRSFSSFLILLAVGFLAYANGLNNPFMMDDHSFFSGRSSNLKLLAQQFIPDKNKLLGIESQGTDRSYYRPLAHVLPMLCHAAFQGRPLGYHVVNLLLFVVAAFLLYVLLARVLGGERVAFLAAVFYLVHPLNGLVVNYITASVFAAQAIFMLLSLHFLEVSSRSPLTRYQVPFALLFFLLALLCHETAMVLPLYAFVLLWCTRRENIKGVFIKTAPLWLTLAFYFLWRLQFASLNKSIFHHFALLGLNFFSYTASVAKLMGWYLAKFFYPSGIVLMWVAPAVKDAWAVIAWNLFLAVLCAGTFWMLRRRRLAEALLLGMGWLAVGFIPLFFGSIVSPVMGFLIEPHWFVFSSIGLFVMAAYGVRAFAISHGLISLRLKGGWLAAGCAIAVVWMAVTWEYNWRWGDETRYCQYWLSQAPDFKAPSFFLANAYQGKGDYANARRYYEQSILYRYKDWLVYAALGNLDLTEGKLEQAKKDLGMALRLEPRAAEALNTMGSVCFAQKNYAGAKNFYMRAIAADRFAVMPRYNLGVALVQTGWEDFARQVFESVLPLDPNHEAALMWLARLYAAKGDEANFKRVFERFLSVSANPASFGLLAQWLSDHNRGEYASLATAAMDRLRGRH